MRAANPSGAPPLLLGAGGLSTGATLVSVLSLGGVGAVFGTRFLLTPEAGYSPAQKAALQRARLGHTLRTLAFDEARGTTGWPAKVDGRALNNATAREFAEARDRSPDAINRRMERYQQAVREDDMNRIVTWAGTGVASMHDDIVPAEDVVRDITKEALEALERLSSWLKPDNTI
jgi:nitronate monooxygenase